MEEGVEVEEGLGLPELQEVGQEGMGRQVTPV